MYDFLWSMGKHKNLLLLWIPPNEKSNTFQPWTTANDCLLSVLLSKLWPLVHVIKQHHLKGFAFPWDVYLNVIRHERVGFLLGSKIVFHRMGNRDWGCDFVGFESIPLVFSVLKYRWIWGRGLNMCGVLGCLPHYTLHCICVYCPLKANWLLPNGVGFVMKGLW